MKKGRKKYKNMEESNKVAWDAWNSLRDSKKQKYNEEARKSRPERVKKKYKIAFFTRCSLKQFKMLAEHVKKDAGLREKVGKIRFSRLLDMGVERLPHDICVSLMQAYDPPTQEFEIRGKTKELKVDDVEEILGIPHKVGKTILTTAISDDDPTFLRLKKKYFQKTYKEILVLIQSGAKGHQFEFLFILYTLGTFLCPTASATVSNRLLKVMCLTMDAFEQYDWATYVFNELCSEMEDYLTVLRKKKEGTCNVGGCLYFLMTTKRINDMIDKERRSHKGIIKSGNCLEGRVSKEKFPIVDDLDQDLNELYSRLMGQVSAVVKAELMKVQLQRDGLRQSKEKMHLQSDDNLEKEDEDKEDLSVSREEGKEDFSVSGDEGKEDLSVSQDEGKEDFSVSGDEENEDLSVSGDEEEDLGTSRDEENEVLSVSNDEEGSSFRASPINVHDHDKEMVHKEKEEVDKGDELRRSTRCKKPAPILESPWILTKEVKRPKRKLEDKD